MCHHTIGVLWLTDDCWLVNIHNLKLHIQERKEHNENCKRCGLENLLWPEWALRDYADGRKSTNLRRFTYCPECGEKIDWKAIRKGENDGSNRDNP